MTLSADMREYWARHGTAFDCSDAEYEMDRWVRGVEVLQDAVTELAYLLRMAPASCRFAIGPEVLNKRLDEVLARVKSLENPAATC